MSTYIIFDLEMCKVPKGPAREIFHSGSELIQIGAVAMNEDFKIVDSFKTFVKPEFGRVDSYITNLTGITQKDVESAPKAEVALRNFYNWLPKDAVLVTWSDNDVKQIDKELEFKSIDLPEIYDYLDESIDCQEIFSDKMDTDSIYRLSEALMIANVDFDENIHDALTDAKNTALLFAKTQLEDELVLSPYYMGRENTVYNHYDTFSRYCC